MVTKAPSWTANFQEALRPPNAGPHCWCTNLAVADGTWHDFLNFHHLAYVSSGKAVGSPGASCPPPRPPGGTIMIRRSISVALIAPALAGGALLFTAGAAFAATQNFTANLSSANEVGGGGASLTGSATVTVDTGSGQVCAKVTSDVSGAVAMHIHKGASGANGPVVVPLDVKAINGASICATATSAVASAIAADPAGYYVNIHTPASPGGALRGQLAAAPTGANAGSGGQAGTTRGTDVALVVLMVAGAGLTGAAGWRLVRN